MAASRVGDQHEVPSPIRVVNSERNGAVPVSGFDRAGRDDVGGRTVHVGVEALVACLPPPAPFHLVDRVLQIASGKPVAVFVHNGNVNLVVLVGLKVHSFVLSRQPYSDVGGIWRERNRHCVEADIAALFLDGGQDVGAQHSGSIVGRRHADVHVCLPVEVKPCAEQLMLACREIRQRAGERVAFESFEGRGTAPQRHAYTRRQTGCRRAGEPVGRYPHRYRTTSVDDIIF